MGGKKANFYTVGMLLISSALGAESRPSCGGTWFAGNFNMNGCSFDPMRLQSCVRGKKEPATDNWSTKKGGSMLRETASRVHATHV